MWKVPHPMGSLSDRLSGEKQKGILRWKKVPYLQDFRESKRFLVELKSQGRRITFASYEKKHSFEFSSAARSCSAGLLKLLSYYISISMSSQIDSEMHGKASAWLDVSMMAQNFDVDEISFHVGFHPNKTNTELSLNTQELQRIYGSPYTPISEVILGTIPKSKRHRSAPGGTYLRAAFSSWRPEKQILFLEILSWNDGFFELTPEQTDFLSEILSWKVGNSADSW